MRVVEKEKEKEVTEKGSSTPALDEGLVSSPALSVEEITPHHKKCKTGEKGKEKVGASIWADAETALAHANELVTPSPLVLFFFFFFTLSISFVNDVTLDAKCWGRRCTSLLSTWRVKRRL